MSDSRVPSYNFLLRSLHWLMFLLFVAAAAGGLSSEYIPKDSPTFATVMLYHKSLGLTLFCLVILRVLIRLMSTTPPYQPPLNKFHEMVAGGAHLLLYAVMIALPIAGYVAAMAGKHDFAWFGYYAVPNIVPASESLSKQAAEAHELLAIAFGALVALHVFAGLWHRMRHNGIYDRIWKPASV